MRSISREFLTVDAHTCTRTENKLYPRNSKKISRHAMNEGTWMELMVSGDRINLMEYFKTECLCKYGQFVSYVPFHWEPMKLLKDVSGQ